MADTELLEGGGTVYESSFNSTLKPTVVALTRYTPPRPLWFCFNACPHPYAIAVPRGQSGTTTERDNTYTQHLLSVSHPPKSTWLGTKGSKDGNALRRLASPDIIWV